MAIARNLVRVHDLAVKWLNTQSTALPDGVLAVLPPEGEAIYGAGEAAINLWTKDLVKELGVSQIPVPAVSPGAVNIPEAPRYDELAKLFDDQAALVRIASCDDIATAVRFFAGDEASFITGDVLTLRSPI